MEGDLRGRVARQQEALARFLLADGDPPENLDPGRLEATARALRAKRARALERAWPSLAGHAALPEFLGCRPLAGTPGQDGYEFACFLRDQGELPEGARLPLLAWEALASRWRPALRWARVGHRRAWALAWPGGAVWTGWLPGPGVARPPETSGRAEP